MNELISIIVPIFNSGKYLFECIESICNQTYENLEIILIDDGSTDGSRDICTQWAQKDSRIRVIHQNNQGAAKARNVGILVAQGELIYFVDSDDYIEADMLAAMYEMMEHESSDCVVSSFQYISDVGEMLPWYTPQLSRYQTMPGSKAAEVFLTSSDIEGFSWNKLIKKKIVQENNIYFDENKTSFEDMVAMFKVILYSAKVSFYNEKCYYYRQHDASCVHTMDMCKIEDFRDSVLQIRKVGRQNQMCKESDFFYTYRMTLQLFYLLKIEKRYGKSWKGIKKKYNWNAIFDMPVYKACHLMTMLPKTSRVKTWIKILVVWINFAL